MDQEEYTRVKYALEQYIPTQIMRTMNLSASLLHLIKLSERMYSGVMILDGHMRMVFQAEIVTEGRMASIQGVYIESSFILSYLQDQFAPTIDNVLLEPLVRKEVKRLLRKILDL